MEVSIIAEKKGQCWKELGTLGDASCSKLDELKHCIYCSHYLDAGRKVLDKKPTHRYLKQWSKTLAKTPKKSPDEILSVLCFRIRNDWFCLPVNAVDEVLKARSIIPVPHKTNKDYLGLSKLRGALIMAFSLEYLLSVRGRTVAQDSPYARMILMHVDECIVSFYAHEVMGVRYFDKTTLIKTDGSKDSIIEGIFEYGKDRVRLVKTDHLINWLGKKV